MRLSQILVTALLTSAVFASFTEAAARKKGIKLNVRKESKADLEEESMSLGSFMVASECTDCNNGYTLSQVAFSGYDKPQQSNSETFFITNNTDRRMSGISLYIEYRTEDNRQLHKRFFKLTCDIPAGETRMAEVESWDKQRSFYYIKSNASKKGGTPYVVIFDPVSYNLRF